MGRPALDPELVGLIRKMSTSNVTWGAPHIRNELGKLGIEVAVSTVARSFPEETVRFLVRDRDGIYGERLRRTVEMLGILSSGPMMASRIRACQ